MKRKKEEELELKKMKKEAEVWKFINKKRRKREWNENNIAKKKWRRYFKNLLKGREEEETLNEEGSKKTVNDIEEENHGEKVRDEEIIKAIKNMKMKKADMDRIPMETWMYGGEAVKKNLTDNKKNAGKKKDTRRVE